MKGEGVCLKLQGYIKETIFLLFSKVRGIYDFVEASGRQWRKCGGTLRNEERKSGENERGGTSLQVKGEADAGQINFCRFSQKG